MKLIGLLTIVCLGYAVATGASGSSIEDRLSQVETLLDRFGRDNVFLRTQISDLKHESGKNKQNIVQLVQENNSIRAELNDVKKERQVDRDEIKKLKSQVQSLREELGGAVSDINELKTKIQELESCGCGVSSVTSITSTTTQMTTWPINSEIEFIDVGDSRGRIEIFKDLDILVVGMAAAEKRIYDLRTRQLVRTFRAGIPAVFKKNQLVLADRDGSITIYNVETGELVNTLEGTFSYWIESVALNNDQSLMLTGGFDRVVRLWDMIEFKQVRTFTGHEGFVYSVVFDETRSQVISGCQDKTIRVWKINDGSLVRTINNAHSSSVNKLLLDQATGRLFSASADQTIKEWDIESGTELRTFTGHTSDIKDLIFSEDGRRLISSSLDNSIIIWDKESGQEIKRLNHTNQLYSLALNPLNGQLLSTSFDDKNLLFWPVKP